MQSMTKTMVIKSYCDSCSQKRKLFEAGIDSYFHSEAQTERQEDRIVWSRYFL